MMDTTGAIVAPLTALWLLRVTSHDYRDVLLWTLVPGLAAAACFGLLVRERQPGSSVRRSFLAGLRDLPREFHLFLVAVGVFGLGDFSQTLLILYAAEKLTPTVGAQTAASIAVELYLLRNVFYAGSAYAGGWLGDHVRHRKFVLAGGYGIALAVAILLVPGTNRVPILALVFALAGMFTGVVEAIEDSLTAEIVPAAQRGMAYGTLAAVNAVGDFASSVLVGALWTAVSPAAAFSSAGVLFGAAIVLLARLRQR
jgi:MFS-type transporter involved in bile tolerance (Atg22 family)